MGSLDQILKRRRETKSIFPGNTLRDLGDLIDKKRFFTVPRINDFPKIIDRVTGREVDESTVSAIVDDRIEEIVADVKRIRGVFGKRRR